MKLPIRIGTRKSPLAMIQANLVAEKLKIQNISTEIITIDSIGDIDLVQPLYEFGITGVFTKNLDIALLNNKIDIAVHSLKDIPTILPQNIAITAVLERDFEQDVLVRNPNSKNNGYENLIVGTGSLRRSSFLKNYDSSIVCNNIRGNVQTRLSKMQQEQFDAVVFSLAGLKRLNLNLDFEEIPNMISAPGQGVVAITSRENEFSEILESINHKETAQCVTVERSFLNTLEGGCSAPIGAYAYVDKENIIFKGAICSLDGKIKILIEEKFPTLESENKGKEFANKLLQKGADKILKEIKNNG